VTDSDVHAFGEFPGPVPENSPPDSGWTWALEVGFRSGQLEWARIRASLPGGGRTIVGGVGGPPPTAESAGAAGRLWHGHSSRVTDAWFFIALLEGPVATVTLRMSDGAERTLNTLGVVDHPELAFAAGSTSPGTYPVDIIEITKEEGRTTPQL